MAAFFTGGLAAITVGFFGAGAGAGAFFATGLALGLGAALGAAGLATGAALPVRALVTRANVASIDAISAANVLCFVKSCEMNCGNAAGELTDDIVAFLMINPLQAL